jgi:polyisoprenyl-teichoic acid--peptidoglycan teichoic acid transferase
MSYIRNNSSAGMPTDNSGPKNKMKIYKRKWFKITAIILAVFFIGGGIFIWKAENILNKVSKGGLLQSIVHNIPGVKDELKGEADGRINVLLLGMRGADLPGGGELADSIILASIRPKDNKVSMISIPRDLYITVPGTQDKQKINYVYYAGEKKGEGQGLQDMKQIVGEVTGLPIQYAASIDFAGFKQLVDAIGGIDITLDKPFEEPVQFNLPQVCDSNVYTVPTGEYQKKTDKYFSKASQTYKTRITASYPLCTNGNPECGGDFKLPAGKQTLNGNQALCFARARYTTSDFERAKRQQMIIQLAKDRMFSVGTLADFSKINGILNALGNNVKTDMQLWEMQKFYDLYKQMPNVAVYQRVLENSEEGLLYYPGESAAGYILLPQGDNYAKIQEMATNIFSSAPQSDISPKL